MKSLYKATKRSPYHVSAGGVVYRADGSRLFYALLYKKARGKNPETWHLPKGTLENGETLEACALRETQEETGLECKTIGYLGSSQRSLDPHYEEKTTHYFLMKHLSGDGSKMDWEHDALHWYGFAEAVQKLNGGYKAEHRFLGRAERALSGIKV